MQGFSLSKLSCRINEKAMFLRLYAIVIAYSIIGDPVFLFFFFVKFLRNLSSNF